MTSEDEDGDAYIVVTMEDTRVKGSISFEKRGEVLVGSHEDEMVISYSIMKNKD